MITTFLGIPVEGDITCDDDRVPQRPLEEFAPLLQAVLDDEQITELGWAQYTPYFNDGDPCVFRAFGAWFRTIAEACPEPCEEHDDEDHDELELSRHPTLATRRWQDGMMVNIVLPPARRMLHAKCKALSDAIDSGQFDHVLLDAFGDHANITVRRDGITVGFYSHD